jgi:hypothetical protein
MRHFAAAVFILAFFAGCASIEAPGPLLIGSDDKPENISYLAVGPEKFYDAAFPLLEYRTLKGLRSAYLPLESIGTAPSPAAIRKRIHEILKNPLGKYLLLVGDTDVTPCFFVSADLGEKFGVISVPTDWYYAARKEIDDKGTGDITPIFSVGRFPLDNADEIAAMVKKTISYETETTPGPWQRKINFVACPYSDTRIVNMLLEKAARSILAGIVGPEFDVNATYGDPDSEYAWHPPSFEKRLSELYTSGCLAWVYAGHGRIRELDYVKYDDEYYKSFDVSTAQALKAAGPERPIMIILACHAGNFAHEGGDSLAEALIKNPGGPPVVYASSEMSSPLGNIVMAEKLIPEMLSGGPVRIGDAIRACKVDMLTSESGLGIAGAIAKLISGVPEEVQIRGTVLEYNLLGDPALLLAKPETLGKLSADFDGDGVKIIVRGKAPNIEDGEALVTLEIPRAERVNAPDTDGLSAEERFRITNEAANRKVLAQKTVKVESGAFRAELEIPASAGDTFYIKAFVSDEFRSAFGATEITKP